MSAAVPEPNMPLYKSSQRSAGSKVWECFKLADNRVVWMKMKRPYGVTAAEDTHRSS